MGKVNFSLKRDFTSVCQENNRCATFADNNDAQEELVKKNASGYFDARKHVSTTSANIQSCRVLQEL